MTHICINWVDHHWFRQWLVIWPAPSHYLNQCWNIVNWTLENIFKWNLKRNTYIFIQENVFENVIWKMAAILSWSQCVKLNASLASLYVMNIRRQTHLTSYILHWQSSELIFPLGDAAVIFKFITFKHIWVDIMSFHMALSSGEMTLLMIS